MKTLEFKAKEPVKLRIKSIKNGNRSLYLDIYHKGKRKYEFLRLYLIPEHCKEDHLRNRRTLQMAHSIRLGRLAEIQKSLYLEQQTFYKQRSNLLDYIDRFVMNRKKAYQNLAFGLKKHLMQYHGPYIAFYQINKSFLVGFHHYLNKTQARGNLSKHRGRPLSQGTKWNYFNILSRLLNKACRDSYLLTNPMHELASNERPRRAEPRKTYLTIHEVRKLADTPLPKHPEVKKAFLFACLCGLRFSDVKRLKWNNLQTDSYGAIVAEADRQIVPEVVMRRTVQYGLAHYPTLSHEEHWQRFLGHLHEKYDHGGYLKLYIPHSDNAVRLAELRALIAQPALLRTHFEVLFEEELKREN